ncbi:MAG: hypothetical protein JXR56_07050 [Candidatus Cloacimonetes bacterium]|nr:hypothetical protein [Candidatus Cloacimonadota bacterium]
MEFRYLKDFAITLTFVILIAFALKNFSSYKVVEEVPDDSKYKEQQLDEDLLKQIHSIELSIQDRKLFNFTVKKDPLKQDLIVQDKKDKLKIWQDQVTNMVRLAGTTIDEDGNSMAIIAHQGITHYYRKGDEIAGRRIVDIQDGKIVYTKNGVEGVMVKEPIPPKPVEIQEKNATTEYNW